MINIFAEHILLENSIAKLVPFDQVNAKDILSICYEHQIWDYMETRIADEASYQAYVDTALNQRSSKLAYPFIVYDQRNQQAAGSTRFGLLDRASQSLEIGWTWYGKEYRSTGINTACKSLLLEYAFEHAGVNRVGFSAAKDNLRSRRAIEKIGGQFEGVLREVFLDANGSFHDLATFSILKSEWPGLKHRVFSKC